MEKRQLSEESRIWLERVEGCAASGISMRAYAERHGFDLKAFYYWKSHLKQLGFVGSGRFAENGGLSNGSVQVRNFSLSSSEEVQSRFEVGSQSVSAKTSIHLSNGVSIEIARDFDVVAMAELIVAARRL